MREILIISGKGGTGKTSITAAFSHLAKEHVLCDLDVDAPDLHLLLQPSHDRSEEFWSGHIARIDTDRCTRCGQCEQLCRFDAIRMDADNGPVVDERHCEGCNVCVALCPEQAIEFIPRHCGMWYVSTTRFGPMVHAQLFPAEENSGRLVALLRQHARKIAEQQNIGLILSDGPPGIGCPVISALSGTDLALIVTEPTPSGLHDLERAEGLCAHFGIKTAVLINKCDLHRKLSEDIARICSGKGIPVIARVPHDDSFTTAMVHGQTVTEYQSNGVSPIVRAAWSTLDEIVKNRAKR